MDWGRVASAALADADAGDEDTYRQQSRRQALEPERGDPGVAGCAKPRPNARGSSSHGGGAGHALSTHAASIPRPRTKSYLLWGQGGTGLLSGSRTPCASARYRRLGLPYGTALCSGVAHPRRNSRATDAINSSVIS